MHINMVGPISQPGLNMEPLFIIPGSLNKEFQGLPWSGVLWVQFASFFQLTITSWSKLLEHFVRSRRGEILGYLGPNWGRKIPLRYVKMLTGILTPSGGEVANKWPQSHWDHRRENARQIG